MNSEERSDIMNWQTMVYFKIRTMSNRVMEGGTDEVSMKHYQDCIMSENDWCDDQHQMRFNAVIQLFTQFLLLRRFTTSIQHDQNALVELIQQTQSLSKYDYCKLQALIYRIQQKQILLSNSCHLGVHVTGWAPIL